MSAGDAAPPAEADAPASRSRDGSRAKVADRRGSVLAAVVVAAIAGSGLAGGLYAPERWGVLAAGLLAVALGLLLAGRARSFGVLWPALAAVATLAGWAAASALWADSVDRAWTECNRLVLYAAALAVVAATLRTRGDVHRSLAIVGGAIAAAALWTAVRLLAGDAGAFLDHRLDAPIGYTNGAAGLFLMGLWPLVALAERGERAWLAGAALALAVVEASLLVLTQSRAVVPALLVCLVVVMAVYPGRALRAWALLAIAAGVAAAGPWTLAVYEARPATGPEAVPEHLARSAAIATLVAAIAVGILWSAVTLLRRRYAGRAAERAAGAGAAVAVAVVAVAILVAVGDPVARVEREWRTFTSLQVDPAAATRFTGAGGYRHDLWRVALVDLRERPVGGVGAGSYGLSYYQRRRQLEAVRQPHSLPLQILAELGIVGGLLMLAFVTVAAGALLRARRADVAAGVAGAGMAVGWAAHTSVDWLYNLPGITCIAIVGLVAACGPRRSRVVRSRSTRARLAVGVVLILIAAASLGRQLGARTLAADAERAVVREPARALARTADSPRARSLGRRDVRHPRGRLRSPGRLRRGPGSAARSVGAGAPELRPAGAARRSRRAARGPARRPGRVQQGSAPQPTRPDPRGTCRRPATRAVTRRRSASCSACALAALLALTAAIAVWPAPSAAAEKAIWGPLALPDGRSALDLYDELGVDTLQLTLVWRDVAPTRPAAPRDFADPAYRWPADLAAAESAARSRGIKLALRVAGTPPWANGGRSPHLGAHSPAGLRGLPRGRGTALRRRPALDDLERAQPSRQLPAESREQRRSARGRTPGCWTRRTARSSGRALPTASSAG